MSEFEGFQLPEDLTAVPDDELGQHLATIHGRATELLAGEATADTVTELTGLADAKQAIEAERDSREQERAKVSAQFDELRGQFSEQSAEGDAGETGGDQDDSGQQTTGQPAGQPALVSSGQRPKGGARTGPRELGGVDGPERKLNKPSLGQLATASGNQAPAPRNMSVLVASSDIAGFAQGAQIPDMRSLALAVHKKSRAMAVTELGVHAPRATVATLNREFRHTLDTEQMSMEQIEKLIKDLTDPEVLIAAGGWCAPSEISYDFYNIICEDGIVDLPTTGINRGGMRWPTSPSFADIGATQNWTWTETMDVAAATGTGQSGTKPCVRVPCAGFNEARLACDGLCVTAGNLTSNAWPEQLQNYLRLVEASHAHYMNTRIIAAMVAASTAVNTTEAANSGASFAFLDSAAFERRDLIERFNMCDDAVVEAVYPRYAKDLIRADLALRTGVENFMGVTDAMIADWFNVRNIRVQYVADWQVRGTGQPGASSAPVTWPTSTQYMIYPAGTFVKGMGMTLDLGVVRDSTLNATNDYTAAWMEECYLVAMIGHLSRIVTVDACATGAAGQALTAGCNI